jgi:hypothetical protein
VTTPVEGLVFCIDDFEEDLVRPNGKQFKMSGWPLASAQRKVPRGDRLIDGIIMQAQQNDELSAERVRIAN